MADFVRDTSVEPVDDGKPGSFRVSLSPEWAV